MRPLLFIAACAGIVIAPFLFESYTFYRYTISEPDFFIFSGARLWFFLASEMSLGFVAGRTSKLPPYAAAGCIAAARLLLMLLVYRFCDVRQCYYSGPDDASWLRLGVLQFAVAATGLMAGWKSKREAQKNSRISSILFGTTTAIFLGYFPVALLFGMFLTVPLAISLLAFSSSVPFFFAGIASSAFSDRTKNAIYSAIISSSILSSLFTNLRPDAWPFVAVILMGGALSAFCGHRIVSKRKELAVAASFSSMIALFALMTVHPLLDAPMDLAINHSPGAIVNPTYYAGAYHNERYFATKRVDVRINLEDFDDSKMGKSDYALAGIGAQSPNCCKDGLDYGYRADILSKDGARYLVARAWAACDQNVGCSAFPWLDVMHESSVPLKVNSSLVTLAMEWNGRTVDWYYKTSGGNWSKFSSFVPPKIENPYFNLGIIWVGSPTTNPGLENAYFYQAGVSTPSKHVRFGQITFECPSFYDRQNVKHCIPASPIIGGNSHWKVLWKWGLPNDNARVVVDGTNITVRSG